MDASISLRAPWQVEGSSRQQRCERPQEQLELSPLEQKGIRP